MIIDSWPDDIYVEIPQRQSYRIRTDSSSSSSTEQIIVFSQSQLPSKKSSFCNISEEKTSNQNLQGSPIIIEEEDNLDRVENNTNISSANYNKSHPQLLQNELEELIKIEESINNLSILMDLLNTIQTEQQSAVIVNEEIIIRERKREIRLQKIQKYREKRNARKWDFLRYEIRKKIAKNRLRHKGRFMRE